MNRKKNVFSLCAHDGCSAFPFRCLGVWCVAFSFSRTPLPPRLWRSRRAYGLRSCVSCFFVVCARVCVCFFFQARSGRKCKNRCGTKINTQRSLYFRPQWYLVANVLQEQSRFSVPHFRFHILCSIFVSDHILFHIF